MITNKNKITQRKKHRNVLFHSNKYQRKIIILPLISAFILCSLLSIIIIFLQNDILKAVLYSKGTETISIINKWAILIIFYLWTFFMIIIVGSFTIASNLVGAFNRIIRELDLIISGKKKAHIYVRKEDNMATDLIKRINLLIDKKNNLENKI